MYINEQTYKREKNVLNSSNYKLNKQRVRVSEKNAQCCCGLWKKVALSIWAKKIIAAARRILRIYIESASLLLLATPQARLCFYARSSHREFKKNKYMNVEKEKHGFFSERVTQKKLCNLNCAARLIFEKRLQNDRYMYLLKIYKKFVTHARTDILYYFPFFFISYMCHIHVE